MELETARSEEPVVAALLSECRRRLREAEEAAEEYFIAIIDLGDDDDDNEEEEASRTIATESRPAHRADDAVASVAAPPSAAVPSAYADAARDDPTLFAPGSCPGTCLVARLLPTSVFDGARESALGNPGAGCRDWHFDRRTGRFAHACDMEQTDAIEQQQQQRRLERLARADASSAAVGMQTSS